jgi:PPOX class probable F420-dependent enzyme
MSPRLKRLVLQLMKGHRTMSIATVRPGGWPQATTVTYANDGLTLYFCCDKTSQKVRNIRRDPRVSLTIDHESKNWNRIRGLSLGGRAKVLSDALEIGHGLQLLSRKFPQLGAMDPQDPGLAVVRVVPKVISVLDYTRGLGHTDLVRV